MKGALTKFMAQPAAPVPPSDAEHEVLLTEEDLETTAVLYGSVKALYGDLPPEQDASLTATFDHSVSDALSNLSDRIKRDEDPHLRQAAILSTKFELADICFAQLVAHAESAAPGIAEVAARIRAIIGGVFEGFPRVCRGLASRAERDAAALQAAVSKAQAECRAVLDAAETLEGEVANGENEVRLCLQRREFCSCTTCLPARAACQPAAGDRVSPGRAGGARRRG